MRRVTSLRAALLALGALGALSFGCDPVLPGKAIEFPRDRGAHPGHRIEWGSVTGELESPRGPLGFQVTFFRLRHREAEANPSRFSTRQILFAHAALADPARGRLRHSERTARALADLVEAKVGDTRVTIDDWTVERGRTVNHTKIPAEEFTLDLTLSPAQPALLQGAGGFSRKGPLSAQASYYYSEPQLEVHGEVRTGAARLAGRGRAWLDPGWSRQLLAPEAAGWDWLGANFDDGSALMVFRIRTREGRALWAGATFRAPGVSAVAFGPEAVHFVVRRTWRSPRTGTTYPIALEVSVGERTWRIEPLMDDQELDARTST